MGEEEARHSDILPIKMKEAISYAAHGIHIVDCRTNTTCEPPRVASVEKRFALFNTNPAPTVIKLEIGFNQWDHRFIEYVNTYVRIKGRIEVHTRTPVETMSI